ncbi:restriction system protein [Pseudonocardia hierapolitana]|uniref:Restriction system protein n=1 Tax=Pseudonocardia hierapolitana TaxID=1128676 RepID=A0A561SLA0_9PSEU|nr:restriction endonuclease [Pseudonocardia hierapolitana]TWF75641.1 restriction system protein [Pseudonocardia hierapolitana]
MAIPNFQHVMLPILTATSDGDVYPWRRLRDECARLFEATDDELAEKLSSGGSRFDSRIQWAITHLVQAGLLSRPRRGHVQITVRGREVLAERPERVDMSLLSRFDDYLDFRSRTKSGPTESTGAAEVEREEGTPLEAIAAAVRESNEALGVEVLRRIRDQPPDFLERLVLKLLTAMGYGGRAGAITEHLGRSGDGGIDGVVWQDILGLDRVYFQAKRYAADNTVGRPDMQAFVGALHGQQAEHGVFITTSTFSSGALAYVDKIPNRIVLIDGRRLAELMILHNVGVQDETTFVLKQLDEDFFEQ